MKKITKWLLISVASAALGWAALSTLYTHSVAEELTLLRKENRNDVIYLRCRIRELESELTASLLDRLERPASPTGGEAESLPSAESNAPETDAVTDTLPSETAEETQEDTAANAPEETASATEAVTLPTHQSPETLPPADSEAEAEPTLYLVAERDGVIGLFDQGGELIRRANVFVMTLPLADRETLAVGIPAASLEEALAILEQYE